MSKKHTPDYCAHLFEGRSQHPGTRIHKTNCKQFAPSIQEKNRAKCHHDPKNPNFFLPVHFNRLPWLIRKAINNIYKAYSQRKGWLVNLFLLNPTYCQKYSQRMEAICSVGIVLVTYTDLETLQVGIPKKGRAGSLSNISIKFIAKLTGLTKSRVHNALKDLKDAVYAGFNKVLCPNARKKGQYKSVNSLKELTELFFNHIGIKKKELKKYQDYKKKNKKEVKDAPTYFREQLIIIRDKAMKTTKRSFDAVKKSTEKIPIPRHIFSLISNKTYDTSY